MLTVQPLLKMRARICRLNAEAAVRRLLHLDKPNQSGYVSGNSSKTDRIEVVDANGKPTSDVRKRQDIEESGDLHATVHLLLFNFRGELLGQRRSPKKRSSAGKISQSVGGHVKRHYTAERTLIEEADEELGVKLTDYQRVAQFPYSSNLGKNREIVTLFSGRHSGPFQINYSEVDWAEFFDPRLVAALSREAPKLFAPSFLTDLTHLDAALRASGFSPKLPQSPTPA